MAETITNDTLTAMSMSQQYQECKGKAEGSCSGKCKWATALPLDSLKKKEQTLYDMWLAFVGVMLSWGSVGWSTTPKETMCKIFADSLTCLKYDQKTCPSTCVFNKDNQQCVAGFAAVGQHLTDGGNTAYGKIFEKAETCFALEMPACTGDCEWNPSNNDWQPNPLCQPSAAFMGAAQRAAVDAASSTGTMRSMLADFMAKSKKDCVSSTCNYGTIAQHPLGACFPTGDAWSAAVIALPAIAPYMQLSQQCSAGTNEASCEDIKPCMWIPGDSQCGIPNQILGMILMGMPNAIERYVTTNMACSDKDCWECMDDPSCAYGKLNWAFAHQAHKPTCELPPKAQLDSVCPMELPAGMQASMPKPKGGVCLLNPASQSEGMPEANLLIVQKLRAATKKCTETVREIDCVLKDRESSRHDDTTGCSWKNGKCIVGPTVLMKLGGSKEHDDSTLQKVAKLMETDKACAAKGAAACTGDCEVSEETGKCGLSGAAMHPILDSWGRFKVCTDLPAENEDAIKDPCSGQNLDYMGDSTVNVCKKPKEGKTCKYNPDWIKVKWTQKVGRRTKSVMKMAKANAVCAAKDMAACTASNDCMWHSKEEKCPAPVSKDSYCKADLKRLLGVDDEGLQSKVEELERLVAQCRNANTLEECTEDKSYFSSEFVGSGCTFLNGKCELGLMGLIKVGYAFHLDQHRNEAIADFVQAASFECQEVSLADCASKEGCEVQTEMCVPTDAKNTENFHRLYEALEGGKYDFCAQEEKQMSKEGCESDYSWFDSGEVSKCKWTQTSNSSACGGSLAWMKEKSRDLVGSETMMLAYLWGKSGCRPGWPSNTKLPGTTTSPPTAGPITTAKRKVKGDVKLTMSTKDARSVANVITAGGAKAEQAKAAFSKIIASSISGVDASMVNITGVSFQELARRLTEKKRVENRRPLDATEWVLQSVGQRRLDERRLDGSAWLKVDYFIIAPSSTAVEAEKSMRTVDAKAFAATAATELNKVMDSPIKVKGVVVTAIQEDIPDPTTVAPSGGGSGGGSKDDMEASPTTSLASQISFIVISAVLLHISM